MIDLRLQKYAFVALAAAALFGISTPLAKLLLGDLPPLGLAGLLYLGSGAGLAITSWTLRRTGIATRSEALPARADLPWLAAAIVVGGAIAPVLLLWGLSGTGAASASLLLNLEGVLTTLLAALIFREAVAMRVWVAALLILAAGALLAWSPEAGGGWSPRSLAIALACFFWALDNNLTRKVSAADPVVIAMAKGLSAGAVNLGLALASGMQWPSPGTIVAALLVGYFSYGISLVLFIHALRHLGSARASAHYGTAPFIGAAVSVVLLHEPLGVTLVAAIGVMAAATWLLLGERHEHAHTHETLAHSHRHMHDAHHTHAHRGDEGSEPHAHAHVHEPLVHEHPHLPDIHHRHPH